MQRVTGAIMTRRKALGTLAGLGAALAGPLGRPRRALAQGNLASLGPEEPVEATLKRLFGARPLRDAGAAVKLEAPLIAENGAVVPVSVEVNAPMTAQQHVKAIYIISDKNRRPLNARFTLSPAMGQAYVATNVRLGESTDVRAIAELADGTLLMARREVKVTVGGCGG